MDWLTKTISSVADTLAPASDESREQRDERESTRRLFDDAAMGRLEQLRAALHAGSLTPHA